MRVNMCHTMERLVSALLFFSLILSSDQLNIKVERSPQRHIFSNVKLECNLESMDSLDHGVFWFRQRKDQSPESILYLSPVSKELLSDSNKFKRFSASKTSSFILWINSFEENDQGTYYCLVNKNSILSISPGVDLYYPTVTTARPKTTKAPDILTLGPSNKESCNCKSTTPGPAPNSSNTSPWGISCELYIWAPLAGLCVLLLMALLVTSIILYQKTRRRLCKCKHIPLEEKNGKPKSAGRYV